MSRVVFGLLVGVAVGGSAAGWSADVPAAPAPRERPAPPAADPQLKKLERLEAALAREVEEREAQLKRLTAEGNPDGRVARLRARADEQDAAVHALGRDIVRAEAEKKAVAARVAAKPDPAAVARAVKQDPRVRELEAIQSHVVQRIAEVQRTFMNPEQLPTMKGLRADLQRVENQLAETLAPLTKEVEEALAKKARGGSEAEVAKLDAKLATDDDLRNRLRSDFEGLRKALATAEAEQFEAGKLVDELKPLREALAKVRLDLIRLRVEREEK